MSGVERAVLVHGGAVDPRAWTPSIDRMGSTWEVVAAIGHEPLTAIGDEPLG